MYVSRVCGAHTHSDQGTETRAFLSLSLWPTPRDSARTVIPLPLGSRAHTLPVSVHLHRRKVILHFPPPRQVGKLHYLWYLLCSASAGRAHRTLSWFYYRTVRGCSKWGGSLPAWLLHLTQRARTVSMVFQMELNVLQLSVPEFSPKQGWEIQCVGRYKRKELSLCTQSEFQWHEGFVSLESISISGPLVSFFYWYVFHAHIQILSHLQKDCLYGRPT